MNYCFFLSFRINQHKLTRFVKAVNSSDSVTLRHHSGVSFVTVNSMAFEGDDCHMCSKARKDLKLISQKLQCSKVGLYCKFNMATTSKLLGVNVISGLIVNAYCVWILVILICLTSNICSRSFFATKSMFII